MKRLLFPIIATILIATPIIADPPESPPTALTPLMRMKLEKSKAILEGLTLENYDKIASNARSLRLLSAESGWNVIQTAEYAAQSRDFQRATDFIANAARDRDISRATMGYVSLTVRCVECHSYMRKHRTQMLNLEPE